MTTVTLTRRGWATLGAAFGLFAGGRLLGLAQLWVLGTAAVTLLATGAAWTAAQRAVLAGDRRPVERLQVGIEGRVDLVVVNDGDRPTPTLALTDSFDRGRRSARFLLPPLRAGESGRAAYRVPTDRRGRFELGPLRATIGDPFGLSERVHHVAGTTEVIVYPRVHHVLPVPELGGDALDSLAPELAGRPAVGGEFHLLRDYDAGDDLRRVHWKATARRGRLMVRQDESKHRAPVSVLLDTRAIVHGHESFELAIEVVASIATALEREHRPYEVVTASGERLGQAGQRHLATVLDALAVIELSGRDRIAPAVTGRRSTAVLFVTGAARPADTAAVDLMVPRGGGLLVVATAGGPIEIATRGRRAPLLIAPRPDEAFAAVWNAAVLRWQRPDRAPRTRASASR